MIALSPTSAYLIVSGSSEGNTSNFGQNYASNASFGHGAWGLINELPPSPISNSGGSISRSSAIGHQWLVHGAAPANVSAGNVTGEIYLVELKEVHAGKQVLLY